NPPSTEFSIGAISASLSPPIRSAVAVATEAKGARCGSALANSAGVSARACRGAWWEKVVSVPRNPYRMERKGNALVRAVPTRPGRQPPSEADHGHPGLVVALALDTALRGQRIEHGDL